MGNSQGGYSPTVSISNWNLELLFFVEEGKPEYPEKNPRSRDENQQQTGNQTGATMVGSEPSHHCATPAPQSLSEKEASWMVIKKTNKQTPTSNLILQLLYFHATFITK